MITRRTLFGFAMVPWAPERKGITRLDLQPILVIIQAFIDSQSPGKPCSK